jgi:alpha-1,3-rhamnosyl/mannosyltransferase
MLARRVEKVFTPSEYVRQKVMQRFRIRNVTVTPNGVDHFLFHPGAKQSYMEVPSCYLLFVGTIEPRKNLNLLLNSWVEIKHHFKDTWLLITGVSGNVFKTVNVSHDMERVRFLGYVDDETLAGLYANAMLFVLPSQDEGFGLPALEAMASGTPVIVSDGGALPEVVGEAGIRFCLSDPDSLSQRLKECLSNSRLRAELAERGLERAAKFSWQRTADIVWKELHAR